MNWKIKAAIIRTIARLPGGSSIYKAAQGRFGRLNADPYPRLLTVGEIRAVLRGCGLSLEGKTVVEVGTGHKPIVPIGLSLCGCKSIVTIDKNRRLDQPATRTAIAAMAADKERTALSMDDAGCESLRHRVATLSTQTTLQDLAIEYFAPADARKIPAKSSSTDYHISVTTFEHIPKEVIFEIMKEAHRILTPNGVAVHFIDLSDHFQHTDRSITRINFLQFSEKKWLRIAGNQFAYCNRLRAPEYLDLFERAGFELLSKEELIDDESLRALDSGFSVDTAFQRFTRCDLATTRLRVVLRKR